jgi:hypothetical protein
MFERFRNFFRWIVAFFRAGDEGSGAIAAAVPKPPAPRPPAPFPTPPPPRPAPEPPRPAAEGPRAKWAKPKGVENLKPQPPRAATGAPRPKAPPRPRERIADPEKWGQYYFRDAILDQLEVFFVYLRRMKQRDRSAYELHRRLGIQILPRSTIQNFDDWRYEGTMDELDAWWKEHRPAFGAVSYGIDRDSLEEEMIRVVDLSPEKLAEMNRGREKVDLKYLHRVGTVTAGAFIQHKGEKIETGIMWVPRFLHFFKYSKPSADVQKVIDGDVYSMTVYWDRLDHRSHKWLKTAGKKGGIPQEYAVCVEKATGRVRVLKMLMHDSVRVRHTRGTDRGKMFSIPNTHWAIPTDYLNWATGRLHVSPEDYLRRLFIEAALMYESASLGSMIRVEVKKGDLVAVFGVDAKRTSYFFKDRDVAAASVTESGRRVPIFHSVRPHLRRTKKGEVGVRMAFRGEKKFEWAGYSVEITVPGRDHFHLSEFDVGLESIPEHAPMRKDAIDTAGIAERLLGYMRKGFSEWKPTGT